MKLIYNASRARYEVISRYEEKDTIKKAGFRWSPEDRIWWTKYEDTAARLIAAADPDAKARLQSIATRQQEALAASSATDADIDIPIPPGLAYLPFQKAGIAFAGQHPSALIADEMGLGKTIQAIGTINLLRLKTVLVVAPASLKLNWQRELEKWLVEPHTIGIAASTNVPDANIVIINYDILGRNLATLTSRQWDLLILDESQYIKTQDSARTKATKEVAKVCTHKLLLTGTPILNRPKELFSLISLVDPTTWNNFFYYAKRYCQGHQKTVYARGGPKLVWDFNGSSHLDELQRKLRESIMVRRLATDVLKELPPLRRQLIPLPTNGLQSLVDRENEASTGWEADLDKLQEAVDIALALEDKAAYDAAVIRLHQRQTAHFTEISMIRHEVALAKVPKVVEYVIDALDNVPKVAIWAHHSDVIKQYMEALADYNPVQLTGSDSQTARDASVQAFQNDPTVRVFVGSMHAAGVGLTLTATNYAVFAESDWTPGVIDQAMKRHHRIGQDQPVLIQFLVLDGSLDARMTKMMLEKESNIYAALDKPLEALAVSVEAPDGTERAENDQTPQAGERLSDIEVDALQQMLRILAASDPDYVRELNNIGPNRFDAALVHKFAELPALSPKQALLAKKILRKYKRQIGESLYQIVYH
jgi:SWI/SNF-related matrix-associated actin-dependent regulator 1 of chromatin subfamily A